MKEKKRYLHNSIWILCCIALVGYYILSRETKSIVQAKVIAVNNHQVVIERLDGQKVVLKIDDEAELTKMDKYDSNKIYWVSYATNVVFKKTKLKFIDVY